jgi:hypothetical protein
VTARATALLLLAIACASGGCGPSPGARVWRPGGDPAFSPYVDVTLAAPFDLEGVAADAGARSVTLAFVTTAAGAPCTPAWGGVTPIAAATVAGPAARLRGAGVGLRVSFGGASGTELAGTCLDPGRLARAYADVLDRYHATGADFDLEGATLSDRSALVRRARAIATVQAHTWRPLAVSVTLPVSASEGLSAGALEAVRAMLAAGVRLSGVNLLAMDYGGAPPPGGMGTAATAALGAAHRQLAGLPGGTGGALGSWGALGVTPMIGVNDSPGETFTLADARMVGAFASAHHLGLVSIWSLARDQPCAGSPTVASPTCSGVRESSYAFSRALGARPRPGVLPRRAVDAS